MSKNRLWWQQLKSRCLGIEARVQDHPCLESKFGASLSYMRSWIEKKEGKGGEGRGEGEEE